MSALNGINILVTRAEHQAGNLCSLIERQGGAAVRFPVLELAPMTTLTEIREALNHLEVFDWVIFVSQNAVNFALQANNGKISPTQGNRFAAVGRATAKAMQEADLRVDLLPEQGFNSEALLALSALQQIHGLAVLIVRGQGGRELLADVLRERGANVEYLQVYSRVKPDCDVEPVLHQLLNNRLDVLTVTSCEALRNLVDLLGKDIKSTLLSIPLVVISNRIKELAETMGFKRIAVSATPSDAEIINTVTALFYGE